MKETLWINELADIEEFLDGDVYYLPSDAVFGRYCFGSSLEFSWQNKKHRRKRQNKKYLKKFGRTNRRIELASEDGYYTFTQKPLNRILYSGVSPFISAQPEQSITFKGRKDSQGWRP